mgnify:FL=1|jgi:ABC-type antimicrobial peptide transport system ATPase subunit|tara:strand:+ start:1417 stop:1803 length:387 start_codon:yes stop_codon:yes gene_type:complete
MKIKDIEYKDLCLKCLDLISHTLVELGQQKDTDFKVVLSKSLATDLLESFGNMDFNAIVMSFRYGVRDTEDVKFVLNVQTYFAWIKKHRQLIWDNDTKEPERRDKRLKYRSKNNTGIKLIGNEIKYIK